GRQLQPSDGAADGLLCGGAFARRRWGRERPERDARVDVLRVASRAHAGANDDQQDRGPLRDLRPLVAGAHRADGQCGARGVLNMDSERLIGGLGFPESPRWHRGRLWFSDFGARVVRAVDPNGTAREIVRVDASPSGLGWLPDGSLLIVSMRDQRVLRSVSG